MSKTGQVKEYFRQMTFSTREACARALGMPTDTVRRCVEDLCLKGWLTCPDRMRGLFRFHQLEDDEFGWAAELQKKIWRAVRLSKSFTVWDIAQLSGATIDYVKKYVTFLLRHGHVEKIGKDGNRAIYRKAKGFLAKMPRMRSKRVRHERARQDLLDLGWMMMRAIRDDDMQQAHLMHEKIRQKLQTV